MADAPANPSLDVKQLVDSSGKTYKVEELASKGFKEIQVLEKNAFNNLLQEAVDRVLSVRGSVMSHEERQKIMEETKMELRLLAQESDMIKQKSERDRDSLLREVENLQQQLIMHRKLSQEQDRVRFDEGARSLQPVVEQLRQRVAELERDLAEARTEAKNQAREAPIAAATQAAQVAAQQEVQAAQAASAAAAEANAKMASQMAAQMAAMQAMLDQRLKAVEESASKQKENDSSTLEAMLALQQQALQQQAAQQAAQHASLQAALQQASTPKKEEGKGPDFEKMMMRLGDTLGRKIASIKSGDEGAAAEYRPGEATMQSMLNTEGLESNLSGVEAKQEVSKKGAGAGALAKLKAMQAGGGAEAPPK